MDKNATISEDGLYRYNLIRDWDYNDPLMLFIMLNPSTADASLDDPTIRRCMSFARREGCGGIEVVNLFAFRATKPSAMKKAGDPVGPDNDFFIRDALRESNIVVCAWGNHGGHLNRSHKVLDIIRKEGHKPLSLGPCNKTGHPKHPLYCKGDISLLEI